MILRTSRINERHKINHGTEARYEKIDFLEIYKTISVMILEIRKLQISTDYIHQIFSENVLEMFSRTITIN